MARAKEKRKQKESQEKETPPVDDPTSGTRPPLVSRVSKFKEGTMNSTSELRPPPDELWGDLGIDHLLDQFNEENSAPPASTAGLHTQSVHKEAVLPMGQPALTPGPATPAVAPAAEGTLGRFSRAVASFFNGAGASFSALGKRKAGTEHALAEKNSPLDQAGDERKREAEAAYKEAKELGLLPAPKVFVRPASRARKIAASANDSDTPTPTPNGLAPPRTPTLYKSPSKKDLQKQKKLNKRVSDLEFKLAEARKQLSMTLGSPSVPPVPPIPSSLPSPPTSNTDRSSKNSFFSEVEIEPRAHAGLIARPDVEPNVGKIVKKRKTISGNDDEFKATTTDSDYSHDSEHDAKRSKATPSKLRRKPSARLVKKRSIVTKAEIVTVVPDGDGVPPIPTIPSDVKGKKAVVRDDGYGGLEHEMF